MKVHTHFEVQTRKRGRWTIEYILLDRREALDEARELAARTDIEAVRVVREVVNPGTSASSACTIFEHMARAYPPPAPLSPPQELSPEPEKGAEPPPAKTPARTRSPSLPRLLWMSFAGLSMFVTVLASVFAVGLSLVGRE